MSEQRLQVGKFSPMTCGEILDRFDFIPDSNEGLNTEWDNFCRARHGVYEYPTVEFVRGLARYITDEVVGPGPQRRPIRILEVAAGRGLLAALLSQALEQNGVQHRINATDDNSWTSLHTMKSLSERLDFREAIQKYRPQYIIAAWLPSEGQGWTQAFRDNFTTREYVLIGDPLKHGDDADWGGSPVPKYMQDGFVKTPLTDLQPTQFCYMSTTRNLHPSMVVSFRRA